MDWRQGFTDDQILKMRRVLARKWRQKLDQVMGIEAVHFLKKEQLERQGIAHDKSVEKDE